MRLLTDAEMGFVAGGAEAEEGTASPNWQDLGGAMAAAQDLCGPNNVGEVDVGADGSVSISCRAGASNQDDDDNEEAE